MVSGRIFTMIDTTILFWIAWGSTGLLVLSVLLGDIFDFMDFEIGGDTIGAGVLLAFISLFCFTAGILNNETDLPMLACLGIGAVAGGILGFFMMKILNSLKDSKDGEVGRDGYVGVKGIVTLTIPEKGSGQVRIVAGGHGIELTAQSIQGQIPSGSQVEVTADMGSFNVMVKTVGESRDSVTEESS